MTCLFESVSQQANNATDTYITMKTVVANAKFHGLKDTSQRAAK